MIKTTVICDGCGKEMSLDPQKRCSLKLYDMAGEEEDFDLCASCFEWIYGELKSHRQRSQNA